jgi:CheY-like chemotaxis protein
MSTIVIVDDQPVNRAVYAKIASSIDNDIRTETFADPREALLALVKLAPDLIITDYKMPRMNGAAFIAHVRSEPTLADVPIIVITIFEDKNYRLRALDAGATDFLLSPVDHREFVTRARNLLKLRKQQLLLAHRAERLERKLVGLRYVPSPRWQCPICSPVDPSMQGCSWTRSPSTVGSPADKSLRTETR